MGLAVYSCPHKVGVDNIRINRRKDARTTPDDVGMRRNVDIFKAGPIISRHECRIMCHLMTKRMIDSAVTFELLFC